MILSKKNEDNLFRSCSNMLCLKNTAAVLRGPSSLLKAVTYFPGLQINVKMLGCFDELQEETILEGGVNYFIFEVGRALKIIV